MIQYLCFIGGDNIPTTTKITKEMILNVAFQITKTDGFDKVSNRTIAKKLNSSIRPIYYQFKNVDESALTGESVPVQKSSDVLKNNLILQEQKNMLFLGTSITNGKSTGIVVSTGKNTEIGKIALSLNEIDRIETPLQLKIKELSKKITFIVFIILIFIFILALIKKYTILEIIMLCSSLAVAAIPEGLPTVITIHYPLEYLI